MAAVLRDVEGDWYGVMVHAPSRGVIHVSFAGDSGSFTGKWDFPGLSGGTAKRGTFNVTRCSNWLHIRIRSKPLTNVQFQLTLIQAKGKSMLTGIIPLETAEIPFATVTLFRGELSDGEMDGICPVFEFVAK
ncbi:hypothetical protein SBA3_360015 [Candidatus Sulfopaludibacter sp. SbA3]|nr:hypothetical protein SBA3_360015 [Candidatus Sulfopaludibacter sp. SbA3]